MTGQPLARIYVSGPIKSLDLSVAVDRFVNAAETLRMAGFDPVDPFKCFASCEAETELGRCSDLTTDAHYDHMLRGDLAAMLTCDGVALLDGWQNSRGARLEQSVAVLVGIPVMPIGEWLS